MVFIFAYSCSSLDILAGSVLVRYEFLFLIVHSCCCFGRRRRRCCYDLTSSTQVGLIIHHPYRLFCRATVHSLVVVVVCGLRSILSLSSAPRAINVSIDDRRSEGDRETSRRDSEPSSCPRRSMLRRRIRIRIKELELKS